MITRREIGQLNRTELNQLREAFRRLQNDPGAQGYQALAAIHGQPNACQHHNPLFLPWHREYIFRFETALRAVMPEAPDLHLPFWDWVSSDRIPAAFSEPQYQPATNGPLIANPLFSAQLDGRMTRRNQSDISSLRYRARFVTQALCQTATYDQHWKALHDPHDDMHGCIGLDFASRNASYDPLFWPFHANVDRYWADWQRRHAHGDPQPVDLIKELPKFGKRVSDVVNHVATLGYDYHYNGVPACPPNHAPQAILIADVQPGGSPNVGLRIYGLRESAGSFLIKIFVNQPAADHTTDWRGNPHFAGAFGIFGMGEGHVHDHSPPSHHHHDNPASGPTPQRERFFNLTETVARVVNEGETMTVQLVAETANGEPVALSQIPFSGFRLES